jgi:predicted dehydrogenase
MRIGVLGCGYWGSKHIRVLQQLTDVDRVVVVDPREERLRTLRRSIPSLQAFPDLDAALDHVDAVVVATPPSTHGRLASRALAAGKHVLVEKPMATSASAGRRLIEEAEAACLTLMVGHTFEYNAAVWKLREVVERGDLGSVYYIDTARLNLGLYQPDINVVWDLAPHDVSIINHVLGCTPTTIQAWGSSHAHAYLEDVAYLRLRYAELGVVAQIHVSWLDPCKVRRVTVVGSRKMAVYNDLADQERLRIYDKGVVAAGRQEEEFDPPLSYRYGGIFSPFIALQEPLSIQDQHFLDCIRTRSRPRTDGESGLAVVQVLEAATLSLRRGGPVPLEAVQPCDGEAPEPVMMREGV